MLIIGANATRTSYGKLLPDGGLAVLNDGIFELAIAEERVSRIKSSGGFEIALKMYLQQAKRSVNDIDLFVSSACCDIFDKSPIPEFLDGIDKLSCPHHVSHAIGSFVWSGFSEAIAIVLDSGGDILDDKVTPNWWHNQREQHSVFSITQNACDLIERHAIEPFAFGFGEMFRSFTYYLGWHGAKHSGNTMALACLGNPDTFRKISLFESSGANFSFLRINDPHHPVSVLQSILDEHGFQFVRPRLSTGPFTQWHFDLAAHIQSELERYLILLISRFLKTNLIRNFVISGGVAYNCLSIGRINSLFPNIRLFAQPASGDVGQCFGNACFGHLSKTGRLPVYDKKRVDLGLNYDGIRNLASEMIDDFDVTHDPDLVHAAGVIAKGNLVAFHAGRSEYGPRALGFRSIVAAAAQPQAKRTLNRLKHRNYFMPVAPAVRIEDANRYFVCDSGKPYMSEVVQIRSEYENMFAAASHLGGWCRVQTVEKNFNPNFYNLIGEVGKQTGCPVLLNTSLNGPGESISETVGDTLGFMKKYNLDYGWINGNLLHRKATRSASDEICSSSEYFEQIHDGSVDFKALRQRVKSIFPDLQIFGRDKFMLNIDYIDWVRISRKTTTVRYKPNCIEVPSATILPLYSSIGYEAFEPHVSNRAGDVEINQIKYKSFGDLNVQDAVADGFAELHELKETLQRIYGPIDGAEMMTIYSIRIHDVAKQVETI